MRCVTVGVTVIFGQYSGCHRCTCGRRGTNRPVNGCVRILNSLTSKFVRLFFIEPWVCKPERMTMSKDKDPVKWAAAVAVCAEFRNCMANGECDQLCRMATHTKTLYGKVGESFSEGDKPELVNERVRFIRGFRDSMYSESQQWNEAISDILRTRKRADNSVWICPRCSREDCSGAIQLPAGVELIKISKK